MPFVIPKEMDEPFSRLWVEQIHLATFLLNSGVYVLMDARDNPTACTDGARWIRLNQKFMQACKDGTQGAKGADIFVLAHEILHVMLMHYDWTRHVRAHGFVITSQLHKEIRRLNPVTKWRVGDVIPCHEGVMQRALDYVINALLDSWGMKIKPYITLFDHQIALPTDSEETAYCRLIGKYEIEKNETVPKDAEDKPGAGGSDMVEPYPGDMPVGCDDPGLDEIRRKMAVETCLGAISKGAGIGGGLDMRRLIDRLLPDPIIWRNYLRAEIKAASGRGQASWSRVSSRGLTLGTVLPGHIAKQFGTLVWQTDVSGSVGEVEMAQAAGCVLGVMKQMQPKEIILLDTDARVQQVRRPKDAGEMHRMLLDGFKGGGSTRMAAGFEWCRENLKGKYTLVTITDGYTPWPDDFSPAEHALWLITSPGIRAPEACGLSVYMPLDGRC